MKIEDELAALNGHKTFLAFSSATDIQTNISNAIDYLMKEKDMSCIYVSMNKSAQEIVGLLDKRKISKERFFIIDCVTGTVVNPPKIKNVSFVSRPYNLTEIGIYISRYAKTIGKSGFVLLDSLEILQMYNRSEVVMQFVHSLTSLPTRYGLRLIVLATMEMFRGQASHFSQYFDKVSEVSTVEHRGGKPTQFRV